LIFFQSIEKTPYLLGIKKLGTKNSPAQIRTGVKGSKGPYA